MLQSVPLIFKKGQIGGLQAHNRFIRSGTFEALASENGCSTKQLEKCYTRLAKGECGLIVSGGIYPEIQGRGHTYQLGMTTTEQIDSIAELIRSVQKQHGLLALQLNHAGLHAKVDPAGPSSSSKRNRALTEDEIKRIVKSFAESARTAETIGANAIQLHAAHGYLLGEFLSPIWNKRTDDYGGSVTKRFEIIKQILVGIRSKVSSAFSIFLKINGHDIEPNGVTLESSIETAKLCEKYGADAVEISCGSGRKPYSIMGDVDYDYIFKDEKKKEAMKKRFHDIHFVPHFNLDFAKAIKKEVIIPVISVGGWKTLDEMKAAIDNQECDFISLSRPFIRDPELVKNLKKGINSTCVRCNRCFFATTTGQEKPLKCLYPY